MAESDQDNENVVSHDDAADERTVREYWTEERMKDAKPIPLPHDGTLSTEDDRDEGEKRP